MRTQRTDDLECNKRAVLAFYDPMFNQGRPRDAIERHVGDAYIPHNPEVADANRVFRPSSRRRSRASGRLKDRV